MWRYPLLLIQSDCYCVFSSILNVVGGIMHSLAKDWMKKYILLIFRHKRQATFVSREMKNPVYNMFKWIFSLQKFLLRMEKSKCRPKCLYFKLHYSVLRVQTLIELIKQEPHKIWHQQNINEGYTGIFYKSLNNTKSCWLRRSVCIRTSKDMRWCKTFIYSPLSF